MTPEEINKKAFEAFPKLNRCDFADDDAFGSAVLVQTIKRDAYAKALEEISSLPTIKGWVAREPYGEIVVFSDKPTHDDDGWIGPVLAYRGEDEFPEIKWPDPPIEVELPIIRK